MSEYYLRKAVESDLETTFRWANDEEVRKNSFHSEMISLEEHTRWFLGKIKDSDTDYFIYGTKEVAIGQVRLDYHGTGGVISYSIDQAYRRQGHGDRMLRLVEKEVKEHRKNITFLEAEVKQSNSASKKRFEKLGYEEEHIIRYRKKV